MYIYNRALLSLSFSFQTNATTECYTLSLHDALPISWNRRQGLRPVLTGDPENENARNKSPRTHSLRNSANDSQNTSHHGSKDRKSTRLNSSHLGISYAVFCLKKKNEQIPKHITTTTG